MESNNSFILEMKKTIAEPKSATNQELNESELGAIAGSLIKQALQDSEFRNRLIANPKAVIAEVGLDVPIETKITVVEETPSHYYLVLPPLELLKGKLKDDFSDKQLKVNEAAQMPANFSSTDPTGHILETEVQLLTRVLRDSEFRNRLIAEPKEVMAEKGLYVPADIQVTVLQETSSHYYLVLPAFNSPELEAGRELSDEELEFVAGGMSTEDKVDTGIGIASALGFLAEVMTQNPMLIPYNIHCGLAAIGAIVAKFMPK